MSEPPKRRTVFVFGSNRQGRHGKGAALEARQKWGAIYGQAEGRQGDSYAIITKELRSGYPKVTLDEVTKGVVKFIEYAKAHPHDYFMVTPIGCGLAGFKPHEIACLFELAPGNVLLPDSFREVLFGVGVCHECVINSNARVSIVRER